MQLRGHALVSVDIMAGFIQSTIALQVAPTMERVHEIDISVYTYGASICEV